MASDLRASALLPSVGEWDQWPRAVKTARVIVGATSSDGDEDIVSSGTSEAFALFDVQAGTYVFNVRANIETAFTASVTLEVGDTDDIDGWIDTLQLAATSTGVAGIFSTNSADTDETPAYENMGGRYFPSSGAIELDISGASPAVGRAIFYVTYVQLSS